MDQIKTIDQRKVKVIDVKEKKDFFSVNNMMDLGFKISIGFILLIIVGLIIFTAIKNLFFK